MGGGGGGWLFVDGEGGSESEEDDEGDEEEEDQKGKGGKGLTTGGHGLDGRKGIHDQREASPQEQDDVGKETDRTHPERPMGNIVASAVQEADHGNGIGNVQEDDTSCDHAAKEI